MRKFLVLLSAVAFAAGGGGGDSTGPSTGTLAVQFDAASCNAGNAEIFVDGTSQGAFFWTPGQSRSIDCRGGVARSGRSGGRRIALYLAGPDGECPEQWHVHTHLHLLAPGPK